jgi:GMP synthase (glutamine-hydrolysing)
MAPGAPTIDAAQLRSGKPALGICYGQQAMAHLLGGRVQKVEHREYGRQLLTPEASSLIPEPGRAWMSHGDSVLELPEGFVVAASTVTCPVAAMENTDEKLFGVQFHPEVSHTENGSAMLHSFLYGFAEFAGDWTAANFVEDAVEAIRKQVGNRHVLCAVSGGVDSTVAAALIANAIGENLTCVFVDHGLMRKNEAKQVIETFREYVPSRFVPIDASNQFLTALEGITEP